MQLVQNIYSCRNISMQFVQNIYQIYQYTITTLWFCFCDYFYTSLTHTPLYVFRTLYLLLRFIISRINCNISNIGERICLVDLQRNTVTWSSVFFSVKETCFYSGFIRSNKKYVSIQDFWKCELIIPNKYKKIRFLSTF